MNASEPVVLVLPVLGHTFMPAAHDDSGSATVGQLLHDHFTPTLSERRRAQVKQELDALLQRVLDGGKGGDPRYIFDLNAPATPEPRNSGAEYRAQAIVMEILYLTQQGMSERDAREAVAQAYEDAGVDAGTRTIVGALAAWRDHPWFDDAHVRAYGEATQPERSVRR